MRLDWCYVAINRHFAQMKYLIRQNSANKVAEAEIIGFDTAVCMFRRDAVFLRGFERSRSNKNKCGKKDKIGNGRAFLREGGEICSY